VVKKIKKFNCRLEYNGVKTLTFCGHVTSSVTWQVTWPFDSRWAISYEWSWTMRLSVYLAPWDMAPQKLDGRIICKHGRTDGRSGDFILCLMLLWLAVIFAYFPPETQDVGVGVPLLLGMRFTQNTFDSQVLVHFASVSTQSSFIEHSYSSRFLLLFLCLRPTSARWPL